MDTTCGKCRQQKESTARRYDYHGIYWGWRCDKCWRDEDPGHYEADEPVDAEPDSMGSERDW